MKHINEHIKETITINENKFVDGVKNLFSKIKQKIQGERYCELYAKMSNASFGEMRRSLKGNKSIEICPMLLEKDMFEIWYVYDDKDKYGDPVIGLKLLGIYDGQEEDIEYKQQLLDYVDKKYFTE